MPALQLLVTLPLKQSENMHLVLLPVEPLLSVCVVTENREACVEVQLIRCFFFFYKLPSCSKERLPENTSVLNTNHATSVWLLALLAAGIP